MEMKRDKRCSLKPGAPGPLHSGGGGRRDMTYYCTAQWQSQSISTGLRRSAATASSIFGSLKMDVGCEFELFGSEVHKLFCMTE